MDGKRSKYISSVENQMIEMDSDTHHRGACVTKWCVQWRVDTRACYVNGE
jgi:hypothetical protein